MKKMLLALGLIMATTTTGCTLYFGGNDEPECPPGTYLTYDEYGPVCVEGTPPWGYGCTTDYQCAAGCYCDLDSGSCIEGGWCSSDAECPSGYLCDENRQSCDPDGTSGSCSDDTQCGYGYYCDEGSGACIPSTACDPSNPASCGTGFLCNGAGTCEPIGCTDDSACAAGCYCDPNGNCAESCYCTTDAEAQASGFGFCDEPRNTCMPGADPDRGSCNAPVTCALGAPTCAAGQVPLIKDGCYTGECVGINTCDVPPPCTALNTEALCLVDQACHPEYTGRNCTTPDGAACTSGAMNCTCQSYAFDECVAD